MKKNYMKLLAAVLCLSMLLSLTACGQQAERTANETSGVATSDTEADKIIENITSQQASESDTITATTEGLAATQQTTDNTGGTSFSEITTDAVEIKGNNTPAAPVQGSAASVTATTPSTEQVLSSATNQVIEQLAQAISESNTTATTVPSGGTAHTEATTSASAALPNSNFVKTLVNTYSYAYVENLTQVNSVFTTSLNGSYNESSYCIKMLVAPQGRFDAEAAALDALHKATLAYSGDTVSTNPALAEMEYVKNTLGFDYQDYLTDGINCILLLKLKDQSGYSIYEIVAIPDSSSDEMAAARTKAKQIAASLNSGTVYEKIKKAHDYICNNVVYDTTLGKDDIHTAYGALNNGVAVCDGYSEGFKMILEELGITSNLIMNATHEWNEVSYNGSWYFVDCTNDDNASGSPYYANFMLGQDVLYASSPMALIIQIGTSKYYYIFDNDRIYYYGYKRNANSTKNVLATTSYNHNVVVYNK